MAQTAGFVIINLYIFRYNSQNELTRIRIKIGVCYAAALAAWLPIVGFVRHGLRRHDNHGEGTLSEMCLFVVDKIYVLLMSCVLYYVPIVVMIYLYVACICVYINHRKKGKGSI